MAFPARLMARQPTLPSFSHYEVINYNGENGLPSNDITGFDEDANRYCWFTTQNGLVRFDGRDLRIFNKNNTPGLHSNRIYALNRDAKDNILFADENKRVYSLRSDGQIQLQPGRRARYNYLMNQHGAVFDMRKYLQVKEDSARIMQEVDHPKYYTALQEFYPDDKGHVWMLSGKDISWFNNGWFSRVDDYDLEEKGHFFLKNNLFTVDSSGRIRVYADGKRLDITFQICNILPAWMEKRAFSVPEARFVSNASGTFLQYHDKIYAFDFDGRSLRASLLLEHLALPLAKGIHYAARHRLYIVRTATNGFYLIRQQYFNVHHYKAVDDVENNFAGSIEIQPMKVFTSNGILFTKDTATRIYPNEYINGSTVLKDRQQRIWFTTKDTLFCKDQNLRTLKWWIVEDIAARSIQDDEKGTTWYCSNYGLARIDSGQLRVLYSTYGSSIRTQCMFFLNDSIIWLGTTDGLFAYNKNNNTRTAYPAMVGKYVRHAYRARDGSIWIGTYENGFYTFRNGQFIALPRDRMNYLSTAHCFMEDDNGFFWIPTNQGLFQVKKAALDAWVNNHRLQVYYHYYSRTDGFATNEFNGGGSPVSLRLQDGTCSLPSMKGLVWFHPMEVRPALPEGSLYIDKVMADTQEVKDSGTIKFGAGARKIAFLLSSPFFGNMANFYPEYRITGIENNWTPVAADNRIVINYLKPGSYTLEVRLRNGFGPDDYTRREQTFFITPAYYETLAFKAVVLVLLILFTIAGVYLYMVRRSRKAKERQQMLESQVKERTQELNTANHQQEQTITALKISEENLHQSNLLKDKLTSVILHDIRSPLRFISMLSNQLHGTLAAANDQPLVALTTELKKSTDQLDAFTREFLVWLTTQQAGFKMRKEHVHIDQLFREAAEFYRNILGWNYNTLHMQIEEGISVWTDRQLLRIILHNLIDNANKHTENGDISLSAVFAGQQELAISVSDTGKGMSFTELQVLQNRLEDDRNLFVSEGTGNLGYRIIRDFVSKLKGRIVVKSALNTGTTVVIFIPID